MLPVLITPFFGNDVGTSVGKTHGATFGAGNGVLVCFAGFSGSENHATGVTIDGVTATLDVNSVGAGGSYEQIWRAETVPGTSDDILITFADGSSNYVVGAIIEFDGALALIAANAIFDNNGASSRDVTSVDVAGSPEVDDFVIGQVNIPPDGPATGWSQAYSSVDLGSAMTGQAVYREATGSGNQTATLQVTSGANCDLEVAVYRADSTPPAFNAAWARGANTILG